MIQKPESDEDPGWDLAYPPTKYSPLLSDLLTFGLVRQTPEGTWVVHPDVARRLSELVSAHPLDVIPLVRFGGACDECRTNAPTRRDGDRYLCQSCRASAPGAPQSFHGTSRSAIIEFHRELTRADFPA